MNFNGGDFNSQMGLHSWSYEMPVENRRVAPQFFAPVPHPPPIGLSAFTARKQRKFVPKALITQIGIFLLDHQPKRVTHEVHDHGLSKEFNWNIDLK